MKQIIPLVVMASASSIGAMAQDIEVKSPLLFEHDEWNFGTIDEADGIVTHVFRFANVSDKTVKIVSISTSCGCTNAEYTTTPIAPGEFGEITVHFSPARTEGPVFREVEVFTDDRTGYNRLSIIADVIPIPMGLDQINPHQLSDSVKTNSNRCNFGYIAQGKTVTKTVNLVNVSTGKKAKIEVVSSGNRYGMTFKAPKELGPEETGKLEITYTIPKGKQFYGMARDTIWIKADGHPSVQPIVISALRIEDFSGTEDQPRPTMRVEPGYVDFDNKPAGKTYKQTVTIGNTGKKDLIFRNIEVLQCTASGLREGIVIKPGEEKKFTVSIKSPKTPGETATGSIYITSNDPTRPLRELRLQIKSK